MKRKTFYEVPSLEVVEFSAPILLAGSDNNSGNGKGNLDNDINEDDFNFEDE